MSTVSQEQIRYLQVDTIADLSDQDHAFAGSLSLVRENKVLYQFVEYDTLADMPAVDDENIVAVINPNVIGRWVKIDTYGSNGVSGEFVRANWALDEANEVYTYTVPLVNPVNNFVCKVLDTNGKEVIPQEIKVVPVAGGNGVSAVVFVVGYVPNSTSIDCRIDGSYFILKDKLL